MAAPRARSRPDDGARRALVIDGRARLRAHHRSGPPATALGGARDDRRAGHRGYGRRLARQRKQRNQTLLGQTARPGWDLGTERPRRGDGRPPERRPGGVSRSYELLPSSVSPRIGDQPVIGQFWAGYGTGSRRAIGTALVDARLSRLLALRVGASSSDLSGRSTAIVGLRLGVLREGASPFDLGVGVFFEPQSIRGDGLVTGALSLGKRISRVSSQAVFEYGQDPEGDDGVGGTSLGVVVALSERVHIGAQARTRLQLWTKDKKFETVEQPVMDFSAGPLLAYSVGGFDVMAHAGISGLLLKQPSQRAGEAPGGQDRFEAGPTVMLGIGARL